jgi:hypothetical protein
MIFGSPVCGAPGIEAKDWTPGEPRHSFVSLLSDNGVPIEEISRLVGHKSTLATELVHRKQRRPVMQAGATTMDRPFAPDGSQFGTQGTREAVKPGPPGEVPGSDLR